MTNRFANKLALIVCTKDRPEDLTELLESVCLQTVKPFEVILVDGSEKPVKNIALRFSTALNIRYLYLRPPSLTRQRNLGIQELNPQSTLVGFIDDDLIFESDSIERMYQFWEGRSEDIGGACFNIINYQVTRIPSVKKFFLLDSDKKGELLVSGIGTTYFPAFKTMEVKWLCGGATVWRRAVFQYQLFDEFFKELGWNEDVDFSYRTSKKKCLFVVHDAKVTHKESKTSRINNFCFGQIQSVHRLYFVKKHGKPFLILACYWACFGQMLVNLVNGVRSFNCDLMVRSVGNGFGILRVLVGRMSVYFLR